MILFPNSIFTYEQILRQSQNFSTFILKVYVLEFLKLSGSHWVSTFLGLFEFLCLLVVGLFMCLFWDSVAYNLGWSWILYMADAEFESLVPLPPPPQYVFIGGTAVFTCPRHQSNCWTSSVLGILNFSEAVRFYLHCIYWKCGTLVVFVRLMITGYSRTERTLQGEQIRNMQIVFH